MPSVIACNGRQYLVCAGQKIATTKAARKESEVVEFDDLLNIGRKVKVKFLGVRKGTKTRILKFKNKSRYLKRLGSRQEESEWEILGDRPQAARAVASKAAKAKKKTIK